MRVGICSIQQALTVEATSVLKQAFSLARRRGHAQVTPLHIASAMLSSSSGLLRRACLQSHSHPFQCNALSLCFNVALNRLPTSTSSSLLGPYSSHPSFSNALVAAIKRAQAHQRRGSIESQQQPILALKIEIEHLIVSILDDPSVSRVMREAGFSSILVKNKVEQAVSMEICSRSTSTSHAAAANISPVLGNSFLKEAIKPLVTANSSPSPSPFLSFSQLDPLGKDLSSPLETPTKNEDVMSVLQAMERKKRNIVITGECVASIESVVVRGVREKMDMVRFVTFPLFSLRNHSKVDVDQKFMELKCIIEDYSSTGVVLYVGDLKWVSDIWPFYGSQAGIKNHITEYIITEMQRLICGISGDAGRVWLMGIATFQTYIKCKAGFPSLETIWELYPVTVPVGSLNLSLNLNGSKTTSTCESGWPMMEPELLKRSLTCSTDCSINLEKETQVRNHEFVSAGSACSSLPSWLQRYKEETNGNSGINKSDSIKCNKSRETCIKWLLHFDPEKTIKLNSSSSSSVSTSSLDQTTNLTWPLTWKSAWPRCNVERRNEPKPDLVSNPNSSPNSASSSEAAIDEGVESFKELNANNLKILCSAMEMRSIPQHRNLLAQIATTILECRSGGNRRNCKNGMKNKEREETWLLFSGKDTDTKISIALELGRVIYGSENMFVSMNAAQLGKKRKRDGTSSHFYQTFGLALNENPHRVFFVEDLDELKNCTTEKERLSEAMLTGRITLESGESVPLKDAIIIISCDSRKQVENNGKQEDEPDARTMGFHLDLNVAIEDHDEEDDCLMSYWFLDYVDKEVTFNIHQL